MGWYRAEALRGYRQFTGKLSRGRSLRYNQGLGVGMAFADAKTVDLVVKSPHFDGYDLIAADSPQREEEVARYTRMMEKLSSYVQFAAGGQLEQTHAQRPSLDR